MCTGMGREQRQATAGYQGSSFSNVRHLPLHSMLGSLGSIFTYRITRSLKLLIISILCIMRSLQSLTLLKHLISRPQFFKPWRCMSTRSLQVEASHLIEEEKLPYYNAKHFYPVHVGQLLHSKYKVLGKLGYGSYSTVWLCHDKRYEPYLVPSF